MIAAIYARVSTNDKGQDLTNQTAPLVEYCERQGWQHTIYSDELSATKNRPKFKEVLELARLKKIDIVLVWKIDRFARSITEFISAVNDLDRYGVRFISLTQGIDTDIRNPASRLLMHVLAAMAEFERALISERIKAGNARRKAKGLPLGRKRSFYDRSRLARLVGEKHSIREIAKILDLSKSVVAREIKRLWQV